MLSWKLPNLKNMILNIVGLDPGTNNLGYCCMSLNAYTNDIVNTVAYTFKGDRLPYYDKNIEMIYGAKTARLRAHKQNLISFFKKDQPTVIACESAFFSSFRPSAYGPLVETVRIITEATIEYDNRTPLMLIEPRLAKKNMQTISVSKEAMKEAVISNIELFKVNEQDVRNWDEHSYDACGIAYSAYLKYHHPEVS